MKRSPFQANFKRLASRAAAVRVVTSNLPKMERKIVFESDLLSAQIKRALDPFVNVVRLLPSPDAEKSIQVLRERSQALPGTTAQGFDWSTFFVQHAHNQRLAKHEVYTEGKTPRETCAEIIAVTQTPRPAKTNAE